MAHYRPAAIAAASLFVFFIALTSAQQPGGNPSINQSINSTLTYIQIVNQSGYLIFYPNLTQAYGYLFKAENVSPRNATQALMLLQLAKQSAQNQQLLVNKNANVAFAVMIILALSTAAVLYSVMRPVRKQNTREGKRRVKGL